MDKDVPNVYDLKKTTKEYRTLGVGPIVQIKDPDGR